VDASFSSGSGFYAGVSGSGAFASPGFRTTSPHPTTPDLYSVAAAAQSVSQKGGVGAFFVYIFCSYLEFNSSCFVIVVFFGFGFGRFVFVGDAKSYEYPCSCKCAPFFVF
jgi:hypothetical protein